VIDEGEPADVESVQASWSRKPTEAGAVVDRIAATASKGISNSPTQTDHGRPNRSENDRGQEKPSPMARHILIVLSAATQTRPKSWNGLRRHGLTDASARYPLLMVHAPPGSGAETTSPPATPCKFLLALTQKPFSTDNG
jgi:hypothetical protein